MGLPYFLSLMKPRAVQMVVTLCLDLSAAFETIDREILLTRLYDEVDISSTADQWFCSYLTDRTQHVTVS